MKEERGKRKVKGSLAMLEDDGLHFLLDDGFYGLGSGQVKVSF